MNSVEYYEDKMVKIVDTKSGEETIIKPRAVENCMKPGTFLITPIEVWEGEQSVEYSIDSTRVSLSKESIKCGTVQVEVKPFAPEVVNVKPSCNPCRNCGRC